MATLRWPPYCINHRTQYTHFLKTVFEHNNQRKDLMDKRDIDNTWKGMVYSKDLKSYQRESLMKQAKSKDSLDVFKRKYTPEQYIIRSGPRIQGTKPVEINGRTVNVPTISNTGIDRMSYIRFASATLPRVNPHRHLDQDTTNQAWNSHVSYIFENWHIKNAKAKPGGLQAQSKSRAAIRYWTEVEAERGANQLQEGDNA